MVINPRNEPQSSYSGRLIFYLGLILLGLLVIGLRLWYMQVLQHEQLSERADRNRIRTYELKAPRGTIHDRNGTLLVSNVPSYNLVVVPEDIGDIERLVNFLAHRFGLNPLEFRERLRLANPYRQLTVKRDIDFNDVSYIESHKYEYPGLGVAVVPKRHYLKQTMAAHVFGYLGEVNDGELAKPRYERTDPGDLVGKSGVEFQYEPALRGIKGSVTHEVNAVNRPIRHVDQIAPIPGQSIRLSIDWRLQQRMDELFAHYAGAAAVIDTRTGELLAIGSYPSFDPNLFATGITSADWRQLVNNVHAPLRNKAIRGTFPPGSVFKVVPALAGLELGVIDKSSRIYCPGYYDYGNRRYRDWKKYGHGWTDVIKSLEESVDTFYYHYGLDIGVNNMAAYGSKLGLGTPTGIDIPGERGGNLPTREWKKRVKGESWYPGDTIPVSIGQGYLTTTPLQIAVMMSAVGTGGRIVTPHLATHIGADSIEVPPARQVDISTSSFALVQEGLRRVIQSEHGTGRRLAHPEIPISGKSGTAQVIGLAPDEEYDEQNILVKHRDHAWFAGYAPSDQPRIAAVAFVQNGGSGSGTAGPVFRELIVHAIEDLGY